MEAFVYIIKMWKIRKKHTRTYPTAQMRRFCLIRSSVLENMHTEIHLLHCLEKNPTEQELDYMSLENHVTKDTPPCFLWQTVTDQTVPVENSYLFAQACAQAGVPFAQHVFSEGIHGLSVATEEWLEQNIGQEEGKRYTQEQVQMLAEAIEAGETPFPKEKGEELLVKFGIGRKKPARWTEKQKEGIRKTLKEVQSWTQLAEVWMEKYLKVE